MNAQRSRGRTSKSARERTLPAHDERLCSITAVLLRTRAILRIMVVATVVAACSRSGSQGVDPDDRSGSDSLSRQLAPVMQTPSIASRTTTSPRAVMPLRTSMTPYLEKGHVGQFAWTDQQWMAHCRGVRTSYNRDADLRDDILTLHPSDPRWLDFVFWSMNNKVNEHQVEAYGGTGWHGPKGGVIFHWAPGSHWERDTLHSFGFTIGHVIGEHRWTDTMFPDFFEKYGGVYGINLKDRLAEIDPRSADPWIEFLEYSAGLSSPYFRYLLHIDASVSVQRRDISLTAGQGVAFDYSFERYFEELAMILTDCKAVDFFQMYDRFGPGFAAHGDWAHQAMPATALAAVGYADGPWESGSSLDSSVEGRRVEIPADLPEADRMRRGETVYFAQCVDCHGVAGDGAGFLAGGFDVKPRDFRQGTYEFRTTLHGELPSIGDVERSIRRGVAATTMPAWGQFLTDEQIGDVARYLVVFSPRFTAAWRARQAPRTLTISRAPAEVEPLASHPTGEFAPCTGSSRGTPSLVCEGEKQWNLHTCRWCHGDDRRGDGPTARGLTDEWNHRLVPADLTYKWAFKNGDRPEDVYASIFGGLDGARMPSYASEIPTEPERWALVAYVLSLSPPIRPVLHLADFATQRATRIGVNGRVIPSPHLP